jgi:hypothetical protein
MSPVEVAVISPVDCIVKPAEAVRVSEFKVRVEPIVVVAA